MPATVAAEDSNPADDLQLVGGGEKTALIAREELAQTLAGAPVDFSFKKLTKLENMQHERPRALRVGRMPKRGTAYKFLSRSIWLNNNNLENVDNLTNFVNNLLELPHELGWLDLSFNRLTEIDIVYKEFPKLKILYLHGNNIKSLDELNKLESLTQLRSLTLHGNPIESLASYRLYVIHKLPQIVNLDFSPIVPSERSGCVPPALRKK